MSQMTIQEKAKSIFQNLKSKDTDETSVVHYEGVMTHRYDS